MKRLLKWYFTMISIVQCAFDTKCEGQGLHVSHIEISHFFSNSVLVVRFSGKGVFPGCSHCSRIEICDLYRMVHSKAIWKHVAISESAEVLVVEGPQFSIPCILTSTPCYAALNSRRVPTQTSKPTHATNPSPSFTSPSSRLLASLFFWLLRNCSVSSPRFRS